MLNRLLGQFLEDPFIPLFLFVKLVFKEINTNSVIQTYEFVETLMLQTHLLSDTWPKFHLPRAGDIVNSWSGRSWVRGPRCTPDRCESGKVSTMADNWNLHCA